MLTSKVSSAIAEYNRYRVNLVQAKLIEQTKISLIIQFDGSFCETCGYYDYYEDLQVLLEDEYSVKTKITEIEHKEDGDYVTFQLL